MKKALLSVITLFMFLCSACTSSVFTNDYWIMDTYCTVTLYGNVNNETNKEVTEILKECENSLLLDGVKKSVFADKDNFTLPITKDIYDMIKICLMVSEITYGAFDITVAPLTELWDIQNRTVIPTTEEITAAKKLVSYKNIILSEDTITLKYIGNGTDVGAIGKGFSGDKAAKLLKEKGYSSGILNLGGNVTIFGENPQKKDGSYIIGIKDPLAVSDVFASVKVKNTNVVTAGGYERYFEYNGKRYHHIIDPSTGYPAESGLKSVTVICKNGILADALATAIYVTGIETGIEILKILRVENTDLAALMVTDDGDLITYNITDYNLITYSFKGEISHND